MKIVIAILSLMSISFTVTASAMTLTCKDSQRAEYNFPGDLYFRLKNTRNPLEMWYSPPTSRSHDKVRYQIIRDFKAAPENPYIRSGFVYTATLPLKGKPTPVTISSGTTGENMDIKVNEDEVYNVFCERQN